MVEFGPGGSIDHIVIEHSAQAGLDVHQFVARRAVVLYGAIVVFRDMLADGHSGLVLVDQSVEIFDIIGIHVVVGIDAGDVFAARAGDAVIAGVGEAAVLLVESSDAGVLLRIAVADLRAVVRRTVVDHEDLKITVSLVQHRFHTAVQIRFYIVNREHNRDQRRFHPVSSRISEFSSAKQ